MTPRLFFLSEWLAGWLKTDGLVKPLEEETGEEIDVETREEMDAWAGEEKDTEAGEEIDAVAGEEIDAVAGEEIEEGVGEKTDFRRADFEAFCGMGSEFFRSLAGTQGQFSGHQFRSSGNGFGGTFLQVSRK